MSGFLAQSTDLNFPNGWEAFVANETLLKEEKAKKHTIEFI